MFHEVEILAIRVRRGGRCSLLRLLDNIDGAPLLEVNMIPPGENSQAWKLPWESNEKNVTKQDGEAGI